MAKIQPLKAPSGALSTVKPLKIKPTVSSPERIAFPGIYDNPAKIAAEAASRVAPESPNLKRLFGVTRADLQDIANSREGNLPGALPGAAENPKGSAAAEKIMTPKNVQRILDVNAEATKFPELVRGMDPWYVMDPFFKRMVELMGKEKAVEEYTRMNILSGMASPGSEVMTEIPRGSAAYFLNKKGRWNEFMDSVAIPQKGRKSAGVAEDIIGVPGHVYHRTAQAEPMDKYLRSGEFTMTTPKVPLYIESSGVPETGFQTRTPVGDAHWSRAVGLGDTRTSKNFGASVSNPEMTQLAPWWREKIAKQLGIESVPAQARTWGAFSGQTGVTTPIGSPKLEMIADQIMDTARRLDVSPETARDLVMMGEARIGKAEGGMVETPAQEAIADTVQNPNAARMLEMDLANLSLMQQPKQPRRMADGGSVANPEEKLRLFYEKRPQLPAGVVADTGQADGVYQDPTVASETSRLFGMDPKADRLSILPRFSREEGLVAPQFLYEAAKAITAPGVAARGYEVAPEEAVNLAMNVAGAGYGAGAAMRNPTGKGGKDLGMFVGQKSNTWDMDKYDMALKMDKAGIDPAEINRYTGYYKNPSSKVWSQEISDASAKIVGKMPESVGDTVPLGSLVRHENLFYAYPDMKNISVTREAGSGATYYPDKNKISIGSDIKDPITQLKVLIHEAQHSIQNKEHFPRGTNRGEMEQFITPEMAKINERLGELFYADKRDPKDAKEFKDLTKKLRELKQKHKGDAFETYMRSEGEAQARAAEERMLLSEKQRREIVPTASFDRPMSQLHQLYANGGTVRMSPEEMLVEMMESKYGRR